MKITLFEISADKKKLYEELKEYKDIQIEFIEEALSSKNVEKFKDSNIISIFIFSQLTNAILGEFKNLNLIATRSTGFDHIDSAYCKANSIQICNVPNYAKTTVAEYVFSLLLNISRKISKTIEQTQKMDFSTKEIKGFDLSGKTLGIIGMGAIGSHIARIGKGFNMNVIGYDVIKNQSLAKDFGFEYKEFDQVLKTSDVISINVPSTSATDKMFGEKEFSMMKQGVILINTARGNVIDSKVLLEALNVGKVKAVALDVLKEEKLFFAERNSIDIVLKEKDIQEDLLINHMLLEMPNVYITPHNAYNTEEALIRIDQTTINNIISFIEKKPINIIS